MTEGYEGRERMAYKSRQNRVMMEVNAGNEVKPGKLLSDVRCRCQHKGVTV